MKIGFFGNANNYPFMLARALRRLGHEVLFLVNSCNPLDRPEYRHKEITLPYPQWIIDVSPFSGRDCVIPSPMRRKVLRYLGLCDAIVLNQEGPSLTAHLDKRSIVLLTGTDLEYYGTFKTLDMLLSEVRRFPVVLRRQFRTIIFKNLIAAQRAGIRSAHAVNYFARGLVPDGDALLDEIGVQNSQRIFFMMTDIEMIRMVLPPSNSKVRVFCATRLNWVRPLPPGCCDLDHKGSDIMIRGLGQFVRDGGGAIDIRLVRKGFHVKESMELVSQEGLSSCVTWLDEMSQAQVLDECRNADIIFEQLGSSVVGMAGLDALAIGRPVIANGRPDIFEKIIGAPSPICHAATPDDVCEHLVRLVPHAAERERIGKVSRRYVEEHFSSDRAAKICIARLQAVS